VGQRLLSICGYLQSFAVTGYPACIKHAVDPSNFRDGGDPVNHGLKPGQRLGRKEVVLLERDDYNFVTAEELGPLLVALESRAFA